MKVEPKNCKIKNAMFTIFSNTFTTFLINFMTNPKWYIITGGQKSNFIDRIKLELVTTCHLKFVVKVLLKIVVDAPFIKNFPNKHTSLNTQIKCLILIF